MASYIYESLWFAFFNSPFFPFYVNLSINTFYILLKLLLRVLLHQFISKVSTMELLNVVNVNVTLTELDTLGEGICAFLKGYLGYSTWGGKTHLWEQVRGVILAGILVRVHREMELKRSTWSSLSAFVITNVMWILLHSEAALPSPIMMDHESG